jgi:predicted phosphoribosyltransferase
VPVVDQQLVGVLTAMVDALIALALVHDLKTVGQYYNDFSQISDRTVEQLLQADHSKTP